MRLQLDKEYGIKRLDPNNLCVYKIVTRENKETNELYEEDKVLGFYASLKASLIGYAKHSTRECDVKTVEELIKIIENQNKAILEATEGFKNEK
jgi:protein tyrosine/serine phosphatase